MESGIEALRVQILFFKSLSHFAQGLDELIDVIFKDHQADPLMTILRPFILGFNYIDKPCPAGLLFQVEKIGSLPAHNLLTINLFRSDGNHLPFIIFPRAEKY